MDQYPIHRPISDSSTLLTLSFLFLQDRQGTPSPMMERSLLYRLHGHQIKKDVVADPEKWEEVYRSKYGRVRIYKILGVSEESKQWVADPAHRVCDVPGELVLSRSISTWVGRCSFPKDGLCPIGRF